MHKIYHPNVDIEGNVCLNILREDCSIRILKKTKNYIEAANDLRADRVSFERNVKHSMAGKTIKGEKYDQVLLKF